MHSEWFKFIQPYIANTLSILTAIFQVNLG